MKKRVLSIILVLALVLPLGISGIAMTGDGAGAGSADAQADAPEAVGADGDTGLYAGAGVGVIDFTGLFDESVGGPIEGFYDVHDNPHARVLVLETNEQFAIVSLELVNAPDESIETCKDIVSEITGTPRENVWVHATHAITTPHLRGTATQQAMFLDAVETAITEAASQAAASFQPAVAGTGSGYCDVNTNRDIWIGGQPYYGLGGDYGESDKELSMLRVDAAATGEPIGFLLNYSMKPDAINNTQQSVNGRLVSSDLPGYVCTYMESEFDAPALYLMGAAADQVPRETAEYYAADENGDAVKVELPVEEGLEIVERLGREMGDIAVQIANDIIADESDQIIALDTAPFTWTNQDETTRSVDVSVIRFGDMAFVGLKPEINALTGLQLKEASPFDTTMIVSFMNEGQGGYIADAASFEANTYEYTRTNFKAGAAEEFVRVAVELLEGLLVVSADDAIVGVSTIGFVDTDGAKVSAIAVEYNVDLTGADVEVDDYGIENYALDLTPEIGSDPGVAVNAYVNDVADLSETGGTGTGSYVIIEVNTDYQMNRVPSSYQLAMIGGVTQTGTIEADACTVTPGETKFTNYGEGGTGNNRSAIDGTYTIKGIEGYQLFTGEDAFTAVDCWDEATGELLDVTLPYALYVPEDYEEQVAAGRQFALAMHIHDSAYNGDEPMVTLTNAQGPANFASAEVQQLAIDQGLGGIIVLCPQMSASLVTTRNDVSLGAPVSWLWQLLDSLTEEYEIDMDRIYGEGQSLGGIAISAMAAQRDNYFAAIWANGCQWGNNYNLEDPTYNGTPYYEAPADGEIIWDVDADGNPVDYRNWFYLLSDDNILITNCQGDAFSSSSWREFYYLYYDLAGVEIPYAQIHRLSSQQEKNAALNALTAEEYELGIYWLAFEEGDHMSSWIYSHGTSAAYEWLLSQTRESEMERDKLDLDKPFEVADTPGEEINGLARETGVSGVPLLTGKAGAGTADYNSTLYGRGGGSIMREQGWTPEAYAASIGSVYYETLQQAVDSVKDSNADSTILVLRTDRDTDTVVIDGTGTGTITIRDNRLDEGYFLDTYGSSENRLYRTGFTVGFDIRRDNVILEDVEFDIPVEVEDVVIDGLVLQSVAVGKTLQLNATVTPANATSQSLTWTSTNTNYATVEDGVVTGVAPGTVIITATADNGVSYSMRVKVTAF